MKILVTEQQFKTLVENIVKEDRPKYKMESRRLVC